MKKALFPLLIFSAIILIGFQNCGKNFATIDGTLNTSSSNGPFPTVAPVSLISGRYASGSLNVGAPTLAQTFLFASWDPLIASKMVPNPGLVEYEVNMPLWTDGAIKRRWMALPDRTTMTMTAGSSFWNFPNGSVFVKQFDLKMADGTVKRIETRVGIMQSNVWVGYLYKWRADGTDADLVQADSTASFNIIDPNTVAQPITLTWNHSVTNCAKCHSQAAGYILGVNALQLNSNFTYKTGLQNQLKVFSDAGLFNSSISNPASMAAYPTLTDPTATLQNRARAYLAVNCASCHQPSGFATPLINIDFRFSTATAMGNLLGVAPALALGLGAGEARINSGSKALSDVFIRMNSLVNGTRMPLVGSSIVHQQAADLIGQWIDSGPQ